MRGPRNLAPLGQQMATVLQPRYSNCARSVTDLLAQWDLDCGITFHYLFVMAQKSAPMPTPAPHILCSRSFLSQDRLLRWSLICLSFSTNFCSGVEFRLSRAHRKPIGLREHYRKLASVTMRLVFVTLQTEKHT